ncbi:MAG: polyphosphate kinase 1, partial [Natronomonas sp.]
ALQDQLEEILGVMLEDNRKRWLMRPDGSYVQQRPADGESSRSTHEVLMRRTRKATPEEPTATDSKPHREPNIDLDEVYTDPEL